MSVLDRGAINANGLSLRRLCAGLLLAAGASGVYAQSCPHTPATSPAMWELPGISANLSGLWERCLRDGPYLAYFGAIRLAEGKPEDAAALLERAMLFAPELASARLDYAEAMAILGDREAARAWMMDVLAHDQPPDIIAERIRARLDRLADSRWYSNARFGLKAGYDTNPMLSPRLSNLTLTLPSGWVTLPVEGKSTRGSSITQAEMQIASQRLPSSADGGTLTLLADARWRYPFNDSSARYSEISGGAVWEQPVGPTLESAGNTPKRWTALAGVTGSVVTLGGSSLFRSTRLMLGTAAPTACQPRAMLDWEHRTYPSSPTLNGDYSGIAASATCGVGEQSMINLGLRAGMDRPTDLRPGGRQERIEGRIGGQHPLYGGRLEGDLVLTRLSDAESYSPILAEGARRKIDRVLWRAEYSHPLQPGWEAVASVERVQQRSNLELFSLSGTTILFGVRTTLGW